MMKVAGIMLIVSTLMLSAAILNAFCLKLDLRGPEKGIWALLHIDNSTVIDISNIRRNSLNSSEFITKSQKCPYLLSQNYQPLLIIEKRAKFGSAPGRL